MVLSRQKKLRCYVCLCTGDRDRRVSGQGSRLLGRQVTARESLKESLKLGYWRALGLPLGGCLLV